MKVLQVCPYFHPHKGGVESHVMSLSRELVKRGHGVQVLTARLPGMRDAEEVDGVRVKRVKPWFVWFKTPVVPGMVKAIRSSGSDLIHSHSPPPLPSHYAAKAARSSGQPFIVTYHCDLEISSPLGGLVAGLYGRTFGTSTLKKASRVIVTTETYAATSRTVWNVTPVVIPNMVDTARFKPSVDAGDLRSKLGMGADEKVVLFVGRLTRHKGLEYLLEASRRVKARVLIVGGGELEGRCRQMAKELGVEERTIFAGEVDDAVLPKYYSISDVLALPSTSRLEAFGIVGLEAMASGRPVVISDIPGVREIINDGKEGLLAEPMNPEDLARKLSAILKDDGRRREMGASARKRVEEHFSVEKVVDRIVGLYEEVA